MPIIPGQSTPQGTACDPAIPHKHWFFRAAELLLKGQQPSRAGTYLRGMDTAAQLKQLAAWEQENWLELERWARHFRQNCLPAAGGCVKSWTLQEQAGEVASTGEAVGATITFTAEADKTYVCWVDLEVFTDYLDPNTLNVTEFGVRVDPSGSFTDCRIGRHTPNVTGSDEWMVNGHTTIEFSAGSQTVAVYAQNGGCDWNDCGLRLTIMETCSQNGAEHDLTGGGGGE